MLWENDGLALSIRNERQNIGVERHNWLIDVSPLIIVSEKYKKKNNLVFSSVAVVEVVAARVQYYRLD